MNTSTVLSNQPNMTTNSTIDHCKVSNEDTYKVFSWLMIIEFTLGLPLNLSVLYIFLFSHGRDVETVYHDVTDTFREIVFFTQIIIPFIILVYCTVRIVNRLKRKTVGEKTKLRRAVCVVTSVVIVFSICFLPCTIARAVLLGVRLQKHAAMENIVVQVYDGLMVLSYIDCLLDPLVYCFCQSGFKDAYISVFCPTCFQNRLMRTDFGLGTTTTSGARTISLPVTEK